jgi:hypothetical protein
LFGAVQANANVTSSGLFYGIRLDNFTINAGLTNIDGAVKTLAVGSLIGYGAGANMLLCQATNGTLTVSGDNNYFSYAGGLIGYQQAFYDASAGQYFSSEIAYAEVSVDVDIVSGMTLYAGGISGYLCTNYPLVSVATVHNSIARGNVTGALRSGGIAGGLGQYSTVSNCYAINDVMAIGVMDAADGMSSSDEYYYATAGGLIGYAENDTIVSDSFHNGSVDAYAVSGDEYAIIEDFVGGGQEAYTFSPVSEKYIVWDCLKDVNFNKLDSTGGVLFEKLGWEGYDWLFLIGEAPEINYESPEGTVAHTLSIEYVTFDENGEKQSVLVNGQSNWANTYFDTSSQNNTYVTMGSFFAGGGLAMDYTADNGFFSYGYFLDPECTLAVPYAYMPIKDVTLYVAFYDLSKVANTYYFTTENGKTIEIDFGADGTLTYTDGAETSETVYYYNGKRITIPTLRLARYYEGEIILEEEMNQTLYNDPNFEVYRYNYYPFAGTFDKNGITLYDGYYFTEEAPLSASSTKPEIEEYDAFKGVWAKSANVQKIYNFDGKGNWTYSGEVAANGTYTVVEDGNAITFTHSGIEYKASFTGDGLLQVVSSDKTQIFGRQEGYAGVWRGFSDTYATFYGDGDFTLTLNGIDKDGRGTAHLYYGVGLEHNLVYEASETDNYVVLLNFEDGWNGEVFGYFYYQGRNHTLQAVLNDPGAAYGYTAYSLNAIDDYIGEWICNADDLKNFEFDFNGVGLSASVDEKATLTITENGEETVVSYTMDSKLEGSFQYKGITYAIAYNEDDKTVTISYADKSAILERKDVFANKVFIDGKGNAFVFDGRSNLTGGGKLVMNGEKNYDYVIAENGYNVFEGATQVGTIALENNHYALTLGENSYALYIEHALNGDWAMRGMYSLFTIYYEDTNGVVHGNFRGAPVTLESYDNDTLVFDYMDGKMPFTYYVHIIWKDTNAKETVLVLSEYAEIGGGDYIYCTRVSNLFGTWIWGEDEQMTLTFDGVSDKYAEFYKGVAKQSRSGFDTNYYYTVKNGRILLESQESLQGQIWYYDVKILSEGDDGYEQAKADKHNWIGDNGTVIVRTRVDSLYLGEATDEDENEYFFDFVVENGKVLGAILVNGEMKYTYVMDEVRFNNSDYRADMVVTDVESGKTYNAVLDYSNADGDIFTLGEEVE